MHRKDNDAIPSAPPLTLPPDRHHSMPIEPPPLYPGLPVEDVNEPVPAAKLPTSPDAKFGMPKTEKASKEKTVIVVPKDAVILGLDHYNQLIESISSSASAGQFYSHNAI